MKISDWILGYLKREELESLINIIHKCKLKKSFEGIEISESETLFLDQMEKTLELISINLWKDETRKKDFIEVASLYLDLLSVIALPEDKEKKLKHLLKIIIFGYISERWESAKRILLKVNLENLQKNVSSQWNERILEIIVLSLISNVQKKNWKDLEISILFINQLREEQIKFESEFLKNFSEGNLKSTALELASLYHFAKSVELVSSFQLSGTPVDITDQVKLHIDFAIRYAEQGYFFDLSYYLRLISPALEMMLKNSIWMIGKRVNSRVTKFIESITKSNHAIFELMYPQRHAILEKGLLDYAKQAIVVNMPTSSGKTLLAEFRILLALNQFADSAGFVVYVAPTRALVNQITARLRRDLSSSPLNLKIESISGAMEIDSFEENLLSSIEQNRFDILVTTPEKLSLLVRQDKFNRPLALVIVDEAHNLADEERGMNLEILLALLKNKYNDNLSLLLLTPFIPNADRIAKWLNSESGHSISIEMNWQPNDKVFGLLYKKSDNEYSYKTLIHENSSLNVSKEFSFAISKNKSDYKRVSDIASMFPSKSGMLILAGQKRFAMKIAEDLYNKSKYEFEISEDVQLLKKYIESELGPNYRLIQYLDKGIAFHHSGLPDEIKTFIELLTEAGKIKYLVSTTTIAQGLNFPVSSLIISSLKYPYGKLMPISDFLNLTGRVGRVYQEEPGIIGIYSKDGIDSKSSLDVVKYLKTSAQELVSVLVKEVRKSLEISDELNLAKMFHRPAWSIFLQYLASMYNQIGSLEKFQFEIELKLRKTLGYEMLEDREREILLDAVKRYAEQFLKQDARISSFSDSTGFSPNSIGIALREARKQNLSINDFQKESLFKQNSESFGKLIHIMLSTPEIKNGFGGDNSKIVKNLTNIISDWVNGKPIPEIAKKYFEGKDEMSRVTDCVSEIYGKLTNNGAWGLSATQILSGLNFEKLSEEEKRQMGNLPAMIYYGVNSEEEIQARKANVPRSIAKEISAHLKTEFGDSFQKKNTSEIIQHLIELDEKDWSSKIKNKGLLSGEEYKKIWMKISGLEVDT